MHASGQANDTECVIASAASTCPCLQICFAMFMPNLLRNFLYESPNSGSWVGDFMMLSAARDLHVSATLSRRFFWSGECCLCKAGSTGPSEYARVRYACPGARCLTAAPIIATTVLYQCCHSRSYQPFAAKLHGCWPMCHAASVMSTARHCFFCCCRCSVHVCMCACVPSPT